MVKNAFGFPISIGEIYAYINKQNGIGTVSIGEVIDINEENQKVKLKILHRGTFVYKNPVENKTYGLLKDTWYYANALIPISSPEVDWD